MFSVRKIMKLKILARNGLNRRKNMFSKYEKMAFKWGTTPLSEFEFELDSTLNWNFNLKLDLRTKHRIFLSLNSSFYDQNSILRH